MKNTYFSTWMQRMVALVFVLIGSISTSLADTKLYIEDFSISAGETKKVAVCLDTDESTIYSVRFNLAVSSGLQLVADGANIKTEIVSSRTGALTMESAISNGNIFFSDLMRSSAIDNGNGPIFNVFVKETVFTGNGTISISNVELKRQDKSMVDGVVVSGATVTKNGSESGGISVAFDNSEVTMNPGETKTISVSMDNTGKTVQGFQADLNIPEGWAAVVTSPRGTISYNASTGRIMNTTGISGVSGTVLNIALTAPTTFAGSAQIKLTGVKATVNYVSVNLADITSTINATQTAAEKPTVAFAEEEVIVYPGKTGTIDVIMANSGITVAGFQADLVLPAGWTVVCTGKRGTYTYNANNGRIVNYTGVTGEDGAMFSLALTAPDNFEGEATVRLTNVKATINFAGVTLDDITLKVLDKDAAKESALADLKAEITAAIALLGEADKTVEPGKTFNDAIEAAQIIAQTAEADMMAAVAEDMVTATATLKAAEEAFTAAVEAAAALAAAKQSLTDEIAAATTLLGEADVTAEPGLSLNNAIAAAQAVLDNAESTTEQMNAAVETLQTAEEAYTAAVDAAAKAAAKMALTDEIVTATTLLGDADKTVEPGKTLSDAIDAAKAVLASDASTEQLNAAIETLKAAEVTYAQAVAAAAEAAAKAAAEASVTSLKVAMENVVIIEEAKNYPAENVKEAVTAAEEAIATANEAIAAIEALISEGKLATDNKVAVAQAINAAQGAVEAAKAAVKTANDTYLEQKAEDEATEAGALAAANAKLAELKAAAEALAVSAEAKAYEAENVKTAVADAETFILIANNAVAAVEAKIAEGNLATTNKEALAAAIAAAEEAIADAQGAIEQAETIYAYQKAADEAAALAAAKADLQAAIAAAKAANTEGMTEESIQALNDAIAAAEAALAAEDATVESLNAAKAAVEAAVAGLMVKPLFADGTYYLFNPASKLYMAAGSSWGTHAVVNAAGLDYIITYVNGKYTLDSQVSNGGTSHFLNGEWNDGQAMNWTFAEVAEGVFTLSNGEKFMTVQENGEVTLADDAAAEAAQWILKTKEDRLAEMAAATAEAPVDATFLVADGNFNRNDLRKSAWVISEDCTNKNISGGNNVNNCAESWHSTFTISQTIEGVPNGVYQMTSQGFWRQDGENEAVPVFFINDQETAFPVKEGSENSMSDASNSFTEGKYTIDPIQVVVTDGVITLGVKNETNTTIWCIWDNFRLSYLGVPVVINPDDPEIAVPDGMINLIANGNLAGDDVTSFVSKEAPSQDIVGATIVPGAGKNNSRGIVVKSADNPAQAWDTQFWIKLNQPLTVNSTLHVEFDYAANKTAATETQAHGDPGNYKHWACIGSPTFTTEWQHFSADVTVSAEMADMLSIAFNLAKETTATEYYFDNFGVWAKIAEKPKEWQNIMVNSNMEGESMECFYVTEQNVGGPYVAIATEGIGKNGSKAVKVQSADNPTNAWDTQFFIRLPYQLPAGTQYKIQFDYKATEAAKASTQMHANPGQYIHWLGIGDVNFTDEWQSFELESTISADQSKEGQLMQTIAFNLAELTTANTYIFDNVKFYVPKDVVSTLTLNPDDNAQQYPVGILTLKNAIKSEGAYNLNGQKVEKTQKGLYIINGKKVVIK